MKTLVAGALLALVPAALDYKTLNEVLRQPEHDYVIEGCCGQRFIGAGMSDRNIKG